MKVQEQAMPQRGAAKREQPADPPPCPYVRRFPIGAEVTPEGGAHFRVWAPKTAELAVELCENPRFEPEATQAVELEREEQGYFSGYVARATPGLLYRFKLSDGSFPDPASRFQPQGPHGPSQIVDPWLFRWTDEQWRGVPRRGQVIYELHIGTFTREGTWRAAQGQLPELARLGITVLEVMPVAEFPGRFGWGYDGVDLFAPTRLYGSPEEFRAFVDAAHGLGLGVILDVVYNHLGPDGNYLKHFSEDYFTDRHLCEWGEAINFDGPNSGPVREFFVTNAAYWVDEFHLDGLRLDATQQIFDASPNHILGVISRKVSQAARGRSSYLVAENEFQEALLARPFEQGGYGLDAMWNDDFHHSAMVALTGRSEAYYSDYRGTPQEFISAIKWGFLYQGQWFSWQKKRRGTPSFGLEPEQFVSFLQNHDQVANSLRGLRLGALTSPGRLRAMTALLLLGPGTPMLFQGQEFGATSPFLFFADHHPELAKLVAKGRGEFLKQFETVACAECDAYVSDAGAEETFLRSKLDLSEREKNAAIYRLHGDLLKLRREDSVFSQPHLRGVEGAVLGPEAFVLRFFGDNGDDRLLVVNLGVDLHFRPLPEPLLAPVEGGGWRLKWSSEEPPYGGCGTPALEKDGGWRILGHAAVVLAP
jgi:maltooligosyltrehalose trehalohydrolase